MLGQARQLVVSGRRLLNSPDDLHPLVPLVRLDLGTSILISLTFLVVLTTLMIMTTSSVLTALSHV